MSENSLSVEAKLKESSLEVVESAVLLESLLKDCDDLSADNTELEIVDTAVKVHIEFFSGQESEIQQILECLRQNNCQNVHANLYLDSTGDTSFYKMYDEKLMHFESKKDYREHIADSVSLPEESFVYGRQRTDHTCRIRRRIKAISKRKIIHDAFANYTGMLAKEKEIYDKFVTEFNALIKPQSKDSISWFGDGGNGAPKSLIKGLVFVKEFGTSLYLGFDLTASPDLDFKASGRFNLYSPAEKQFAELFYVFKEVAGVSKTWIKVHPGDNIGYEFYGCNPGMGDSPSLWSDPVTPEHYYYVFRG
jgi:hypothetical protein